MWPKLLSLFVTMWLGTDEMEGSLVKSDVGHM